MNFKPLGKPEARREAIVITCSVRGAGRVPLVAVSGTNGKTLVASLIGSMLSAAGRTLGQADSMGIRARGRTLSDDDGTSRESARRVLMNPFVDAIVLEVSEASVLARAGVRSLRSRVATNQALAITRKKFADSGSDAKAYARDSPSCSPNRLRRAQRR